MTPNKVMEKSWIKSLNKKIKLFFGRDFFQNKIIMWLLFFGVFSNFVNWVILGVFLPEAEKNIILHYNVYFGVDSIGNSREAFLLPSIGFIILLINAPLALYFYLRKERVASYILLLSASMAQLSLLISVISVIIINY